MSNYLQDLSEKELISQIKQLKAKKEVPYSLSKTDEEDIRWGNTHFFSRLLMVSRVEGTFFSKNQVEHFKDSFCKERDVVIDLDSLFERNWLRTVLGWVKVSRGVSSLAREHKKREGQLQEIIFLLQLENELGKTAFSKEEINQSIEAYVDNEGKEVDKKGIFSFLQVKGGLHQFNNPNFFRLLTDNWNELGFLSWLLNHERSKITVKKEQLVEIFDNHQSFFSSTPSLDELISEYSFKDLGEEYEIKFQGEGVHFSTPFQSKILGQYWELLIQDDSFDNDEERVRVWLMFTSSLDGYIDFSKYIVSTSLQRFIHAAISLVTKEEDLLDEKDDFIKRWLDHRDSPYKRFNIEVPKELMEIPEDAMSKYYHTSYIDDQYGINEYDFPSRNYLNSLIFLVILLDKQHSNVPYVNSGIKYSKYANVFKLFCAGLNKNHLLRETSLLIRHNRPELIVFLLSTEKFCCLGLCLLDELLLQEDRDVKLRLWSEGVRLVLNSNLQKTTLSLEDRSLIISQIYYLLYKGKYEHNSTFLTFEQKQNRVGFDRQKEKITLDLIENCPLHGYNISGSNQFLLPLITPKLLDRINQWNSYRIHNPSYIRFPLAELGALSSLIRLLRQSYRDAEDVLKQVLKLFIKKYQIAITSQVDTNGKSITWVCPNDKLQYIDWSYPACVMHEYGWFSDILAPNIETYEDELSYNPNLVDSLSRIRSHFMILLLIIEKCSIKEQLINIDSKLKVDVKNRAEIQLIDYIKRYGEGEPHLFDSSLFEGSSIVVKLPLIPELGRRLELFSDKENLIEAFYDKKDFKRVIRLFKWVGTVGLKAIIIDKLKEERFEELLKEGWWKEVEELLYNLIEEPELTLSCEKVVLHWESKLQKESDMSLLESTFRLKCVLAYLKKDWSTMKSLSFPNKEKLIQSDKRNIQATETFYRGLMNLEIDPKKAYEDFNLLCSSEPRNVSSRINRFAARIRWADKEKSISGYREGLKEWDDFESETKLDLTHIRDSIAVNKLKVYLETSDHDAFKKFFINLEDNVRFVLDVIELRIEQLLTLGNRDEAKRFIEDSINYHTIGGRSIPKLLLDLKRGLYDESSIQKMGSTYLEIIGNSPENVVKILPSNYHNQSGLIPFMVKEIVRSSNELLNKVKALESVHYEDKYNDLIQVILGARLSFLKWVVVDQSRAAFSASHKSLGERDLVIKDSNEEMLVCEAFILRSKELVQSHLFKVFNYYHHRRAFAILVYNTQGTHRGFNTKWKNYCEKTVPNCNFPKGFELKDKKVEDVCDEFNVVESAIKVGKARHGKNTILYHIMLNMNYKVN
ncbi:hypothetical protein [Reichenbachiella versicolor]|uniref:hypothetical protein n=1 Tax=Reichenbachiella versicolor TaxID=1821036 RepID=UPI000D6DE96F|nr:hypothetical protein [Reichenbachiella versicolor]